MARAFGLAGSQAAGTFAAWGTPTVKFHQCRGALSGLMAALLAQQKFVATREFLTAKDGGLYNTYVDGGKPDVATADLGTRWELEQIAMRLWPSATLIQGMNTALFDLLGKHNIDPARIAKVRIGLSQQAFGMHGGFGTYKAKFEALLSAHYTAAVILHDRALTLAQFEPGRYDDPKLRRVRGQAGRGPRRAVGERLAGASRYRDGRWRDALGALRASARRVRKSGVARADRAEIPHLCPRLLARRPYRRRRSGRSNGWRISARCAG